MIYSSIDYDGYLIRDGAYECTETKEEIYGAFHMDRETRDWIRASWSQTFKIIYRPILTRARSFHRRMLLSISGWLARAGKRLKDRK